MWNVVPGVTFTLVVVLRELVVDLVLVDVDARLQVRHAGRRVDDVVVHLASRTDPLSAALDADLDRRRRAARQRHWTTLDDVVDRVRLDDEHRGLRVWRHRRTRARRRQHD